MICMKPTITLIRAIGTEFVRRTIRPLIILGTIAAVVLLGIGGYLTTINAWWGILEAAIVVSVLVFVALSIIVRIMIRVVDPPQSTTQRQAVRKYVDKLQRVSDHLQTPQPVVLFRVIRDTIWPREENPSFIETVSKDTKTLTPDFVELQKEFQSKRDTSVS